MISFDEKQRAILLRLRNSFYSIRILPGGEVVHIGSGPLPANMPDHAWLGGLDDYEESNFEWDRQGRRFELPTFGDINFHDVALKVSFPDLAGPLVSGEVAHLPVRDLRLRYQSHEVRVDATPGFTPEHGQSAGRGRVRETLCLRLKDIAYDFFVTLFYRVNAEHDIIERWLELENRTAMEVAVDALAFGTMHLPNGHYELTRAAGAWAREFIPVRQLVEQGVFLLEQKGLNTGHASNPFFQLNERGGATEEEGTVFFGALAYSGNWALRFESLPSTALRIHGGYEAADFELSLAPGQTHRTPSFVHGCSGEGRGGASRQMHRFIRDCVLPGSVKNEFRPVLYNGWEAAYFDLSFESQIELARLAASIGVELFCVDDGWFGARRHDRAGLGDWTVSEDVFPGGLRPLVDEVHQLGMKFGLWVEPEMVNPDSDLYRAHPEWVLHFPGRPRTESRSQLILDFGRPEVVEHILAALDTLVRENSVDFFKWDMNRYATEPGSVAGRAIWHEHVAGVYRIMDALRCEHPGLAIQSCSGGGGRVDLGMLARTDQVWTSDNTDAYDRTLIQEGFSLAYPPRVMESWVTHEKNHQTGRIASLDLRFDAAMRGALGIGAALNKLSPEELAVCRRKIAFYKKIRPIVQGGDLYRLSSAVETGVSIWQSVEGGGSRAVYSIIVLGQLLAVHLAPTRLRGLRPEAIYAVSDDTGAELGRYSGAQLLTIGLPGDGAQGGAGRSTRSRTVLLEIVN